MESGTDKKFNILLITGGSPASNSPRMAFDMVESLKSNGHHVDLLLKYPISNDSINIISVYPHSDIFKHRVYDALKRRFSLIKKVFKPLALKLPLAKYNFFNIDEEKPPVPASLILNKIKIEYDFILVFFWQWMLTSKSILEIYNRLKIPVLLIAADMFPMTGGCSYFWDCRNFENSCGKCPAISSDDPHDFTNKIFLYKKNVFNNINCALLVNSWAKNHAIKSRLFKNINTIYPVVNETIFKPRNREDLRSQYNIDGKIVLFTGAVHVNEERKGFKYLVEALALLSKRLPESIKDDVVLVIAGNLNLDLPSYFNLRVLQAGYLTYEILADYYAMADIYLSPTIQDAGPMMVNQSLMCGTPVVSFEIGTACDVVTENTGYIARYKDADDFCNGIMKLLELNAEEKEILYEQCRKMALNTSSYKAFESNILAAYKDLAKEAIVSGQI